MVDVVSPEVKEKIERLCDLFANSHAAREIFRQIYEASPPRKSAYHIMKAGVRLPSGNRAKAYSGVHYWIKKLRENGAIVVAAKELGEKKVNMIIYTYTEVGRQAYELVMDYYEKRAIKAAKIWNQVKRQSEGATGLHAPDLLKAVLELAEKEKKENREKKGI